ncbi:MAG: hypothetical protein H7A35_15375 [Planctomycetales bacterium]|nr:MAG: hypothetical protein H7A35_15375 [Planctomycetales bacterium]
MSITDLVSAFVNLHSAIKIVLGAVPFLIGLYAWVRLRIKFQRCYIRLVRALPRYVQYLKDRKTALGVMDHPQQLRFEEAEKRIAIELKLNLQPSMTSWWSYLNPGQRDYLSLAIRQLESSTFCIFADDLLQRLILVLDTMTDYENLRRQSRWTLDAMEHSRQREKLRKQLEEDFSKLDRHIRLIQKYLAGQLDVDICPAIEAGMFRSLLDEKYSAYEALSREDIELATMEVAN